MSLKKISKEQPDSFEFNGESLETAKKITFQILFFLFKNFK